MIRILLIGCGDVALRAASMLRGRAQIYGLVRRADELAKLRARGIVPIVADLDDFATLRRLVAVAFRGAAHRAAPLRRPRRSSHAEASCCAVAGANYTAAIRLHFHVGRLRRLRGCARGRDASASCANAAGEAARRGGGSPARVGRAQRRHALACCARPASIPRRACRSSACARARPCSPRTPTCSPITSTPTTWRARP